MPDWLGGEQPYDLNSWQESETALALADTLDEDAVIVEGYAEYATWRPHLAYLRDPYGDPDMEMEIDGVGGVSILAKAAVFRSGVHFPAFSFEKHAETEGFGKVRSEHSYSKYLSLRPVQMAKRMDFSVVGLPHYTVWHLYEPSVDDIRHMEEMEQERKNRENEERERAERMKKIKEDFDVPTTQWDKDKADIEGITQKDEEAKKQREQPPEEASEKVSAKETVPKDEKKASEKLASKEDTKDIRKADVVGERQEPEEADSPKPKAVDQAKAVKGDSDGKGKKDTEGQKVAEVNKKTKAPKEDGEALKEDRRTSGSKQVKNSRDAKAKVL